MRQTAQFLALVASIAATASAGTIQGFNYGATGGTGTGGVRTQSDFETLFATAKNLVGTDNAFTSARLYTMIQGGTTSDVTSAIPAAIKEGTTLLLGLWASGTAWDNELAALKAAISTYGPDLGRIVTGIAIGSEDLYRNSPTGIQAGSTIGQQPDVLVSYIKAVREAISGTSLSSASIGHVDTWTAWVNGTNAEVIENCDWLGFDGYPYWQLADSNAVSNGKSLFVESYQKVVAVAGGKDVWVTETGWAVTDDNGSEGEAVAGTAEAKTYWDDVGCGYLFGNINTYWYTLEEAGSTPNFGVSESASSTTPLYDLSCSGITANTSDSSSSSASASPSASASTTGSAATALTTGTVSSGSGSSSGSNNVNSNGTATTGYSGNTTVTTAKASGTASGTASSAKSSSSASSTNSNSTGAAMTNMASLGGVLAAGVLALFAAL